MSTFGVKTVTSLALGLWPVFMSLMNVCLANHIIRSILSVATIQFDGNYFILYYNSTNFVEKKIAMKIFLSYGHDSNAPLIMKIKEYLSADLDGRKGHEVWIDTSEIKAGEDWRRKITEGVVQSNVVLAGLSNHSTREPGVCRDELNISIGVKGGNIKTILLEPSDIVSPPAVISHIQWLDMSDWKDHYDGSFDSDYFKEHFAKIREMVEMPENEVFDGEISRLRTYLTPISSIGRFKYLTKNTFYGREWIIDDLTAWDRLPDQRIFWIMGGPGFGKSTFSANLQLRYNHRIPAIHFVEWGKPHHSDPCTILRNLAFQLAVRFPEYRKILLSYPDNTLNSLINMSEGELFQILFCDNSWYVVDGDRENVWILIDALDEASDDYGNKIAETLSRHVEQLPTWMRFVITSRNDPKVKQALRRFNPQILDVEESSIAHTLDDMKAYLDAELKREEFKEELLKRSNGVFLYLRLCVEAINNGTLKADEMDSLPLSLADFYYQTFTRFFRERMEYYRKSVVPILESMVGSEAAVSIPFAQYCSELASDYEFYEALSDVENICNIDKQDHSGFKTISFFHQSIKDWLLDPQSSRQFFVSKRDAQERMTRNMSRWLVSADFNDAAYWSKNAFGFQHLKNVSLTEVGPVDASKLFLMIDSISVNSTFGSMLSTRNYEVNYLLEFIDAMACSNDRVAESIQFIESLFKAVKDKYIEVGFVSKETQAFSNDYDMMEKIAPSNVWKAIQAGAVIGIIGHHVAENPKAYKRSFKNVLKDKMTIIAHYDYRIGDVFALTLGSLCDLGDFASREMCRVKEKIQ